MTTQTRIVVIGAGIGGLTTAALLAQAGHDVTVLETQTYPGGSAGTFFHKGYRFDAGATVAGGMQPGGPHARLAERLGLTWPVRPHDPAWIVHLPDRQIALTRDNADVLAHFPASAGFWDEQSILADLCWRMSDQGLPWPPADLRELSRLAATALRNLPADLRLLPFTLMTAHDWLRRRGLADDPAAWPRRWRRRSRLTAGASSTSSVPSRSSPRAGARSPSRLSGCANVRHSRQISSSAT